METTTEINRTYHALQGTLRNLTQQYGTKYLLCHWYRECLQKHAF